MMLGFILIFLTQVQASETIFEDFRDKGSQVEWTKLVRTVEKSQQLEAIESAIQIAEESFPQRAPQILEIYEKALKNPNLIEFQKQRFRARKDALLNVRRVMNEGPMKVGQESLRLAIEKDRGPKPRHLAEAYYIFAFRALVRAFESEGKSADALYGACKAAAVVMKGSHEKYFLAFFEKFPKDKRVDELFQKFALLVDEAYREGSGPSQLPVEEKEKLDRLRKKLGLTQKVN